jgi:hypothetical protein
MGVYPYVSCLLFNDAEILTEVAVTARTLRAWRTEAWRVCSGHMSGRLSDLVSSSLRCRKWRLCMTPLIWAAVNNSDLLHR